MQKRLGACSEWEDRGRDRGLHSGTVSQSSHCGQWSCLSGGSLFLRPAGCRLGLAVSGVLRWSDGGWRGLNPATHCISARLELRSPRALFHIEIGAQMGESRGQRNIIVSVAFLLIESVKDPSIGLYFSISVFQSCYCIFKSNLRCF